MDMNDKITWQGIIQYTNDLKKWIFNLFQKVHARIGHVEEDLYKMKEITKSTYSIQKKIVDDSIVYVLVDDTTKQERGTINVSTGGVVLTTWEEDINI